MTTKAKVEIPKDKIESFCKEYHIKKLSLFGSVLREDFRQDSDIDILVEFEKNVRYSLFDLARMEEELKRNFKRNIDLVDKRSVEQSENYIRRKHILNSAKALYVAG